GFPKITRRGSSPESSSPVRSLDSDGAEGLIGSAIVASSYSMSITVVMPPRRQCTCSRAPCERDISPANFAKIYAVGYGRNDTQASTANTKYFGRTDARGPRVKAQPGRA